MFDRVSHYVLDGGFVMPVLLVVGVVLWTALALRFQLLRRGFRGPLDDRCRVSLAAPPVPAKGLVDAFIRDAAKVPPGPRAGVECELDVFQEKVNPVLVQYRAIIRGLCGAAPLLGLLGTVTGMIETFSSLTAMELFSQSGGVAGGISEALISTQMGLFVAIPGVIAGRYLDNVEERLRTDVERAREILVRLVAGPAEVAP